jgi:hypothetical protein
LLIAMIVALILPANNAHGQPAQPPPKAGDEFEISRRYETSQQASDGSSGNSRGQDALLERVIVVREGGAELEYDLPRSATAQDRARHWEFPVRVFRPPSGPMELLNRAELEARVERWLQAAGWTREACGRWIFTWNAFRIECDPQSVIRTLESLDLRFADLREGAPYREAEALGPGALIRQASGPSGETFAVTMQIDPDAVRRAHAESDVVVGEITNKPTTLDAAMSKRAKESVSGTISVTLETDSAGNVWRRTKVTKLEITGPDDRHETQTATETVERRPVPRSAGFGKPPASG